MGQPPPPHHLPRLATPHPPTHRTEAPRRAVPRTLVTGLQVRLVLQRPQRDRATTVSFLEPALPRHNATTLTMTSHTHGQARCTLAPTQQAPRTECIEGSGVRLWCSNAAVGARRGTPGRSHGVGFRPSPVTPSGRGCPRRPAPPRGPSSSHTLQREQLPTARAVGCAREDAMGCQTWVTSSTPPAPAFPCCAGPIDVAHRARTCPPAPGKTAAECPAAHRPKNTSRARTHTATGTSVPPGAWAGHPTRPTPCLPPEQDHQEGKSYPAPLAKMGATKAQVCGPGAWVKRCAHAPLPPACCVLLAFAGALEPFEGHVSSNCGRAHHSGVDVGGEGKGGGGILAFRGVVTPCRRQAPPAAPAHCSPRCVRRGAAQTSDAAEQLLRTLEEKEAAKIAAVGGEAGSVSNPLVEGNPQFYTEVCVSACACARARPPTMDARLSPRVGPAHPGTRACLRCGQDALLRRRWLRTDPALSTAAQEVRGGSVALPAFAARLAPQ
jgi:hypothetical protein